MRRQAGPLNTRGFGPVFACCAHVRGGEPASSLTQIVTRTHREFGGLLLADGRTVTVGASRRIRECIGVHLVGTAGDATDVLHGLLRLAEARLPAPHALALRLRAPH